MHFAVKLTKLIVLMEKLNWRQGVGVLTGMIELPELVTSLTLEKRRPRGFETEKLVHFVSGTASTRTSEELTWVRPSMMK